MADRRLPSNKPKGAGAPSRINRLLAAKVTREYGKLTNLIMVSNRGLNSEETGELRANLSGKGIAIRVVRSRITLRAFREMGLSDAEKLFSGPTAIIDADDPVLAAKMAVEFCKKFDNKLVIVGGLLEGKVLNKNEILTLSKSKSRPELLAELSLLLKSPGARIAAQLKGPGGRVAGALKTLVEKLEKAEAAAAAAQPVAVAAAAAAEPAVPAEPPKA